MLEMSSTTIYRQEQFLRKTAANDIVSTSWENQEKRHLKYGASSSILILDYNLAMNKFQVVRRVEVPKVEYSFDKAVNMIIELNKIYQPSFIYADRGMGGYILK